MDIIENWHTLIENQCDVALCVCVCVCVLMQTITKPHTKLLYTLASARHNARECKTHFTLISKFSSNSTLYEKENNNRITHTHTKGGENNVLYPQ